MKKNDPAGEKTYEFALKVIQLSTILKSQREFDISRQLLRSGTSIGANLREAKGAQSRKDFIAKVHVSLKEAKESEYWISLLLDSGIVDVKSGNELKKLCSEILALLTSTLKTSKARLSD